MSQILSLYASISPTFSGERGSTKICSWGFWRFQWFMDSPASWLNRAIAEKTAKGPTWHERSLLWVTKKQGSSSLLYGIKWLFSMFAPFDASTFKKRIVLSIGAWFWREILGRHGGIFWPAMIFLATQKGKKTERFLGSFRRPTPKHSVVSGHIYVPSAQGRAAWRDVWGKGSWETWGFLEAQLNLFFFGKVASETSIIRRFGQKHAGQRMAFDSCWSSSVFTNPLFDWCARAWYQRAQWYV